MHSCRGLEFEADEASKKGGITAILEKLRNEGVMCNRCGVASGGGRSAFPRGRRREEDVGRSVA